MQMLSMSVFSRRRAPGRSAVALAATIASFAILAIGASGAGAYTFNQTYSNASGNTTTGLTIAAGITGSESQITQLTVSESSLVGFNFPAYGSTADRCPSASMPTDTSAFNPATCPAKSKIGTITAVVGSTTKTGSIYVINKNPAPWFGVDLGSSFRFALVPTFPYEVPSCDPATDPNGFCQQYLQLRTTSFGSNKIKSTTIKLGGVSRAPLPSDPFSINQTNPCSPSTLTKGAIKNAAGSTTTISDTDLLTGCTFNPTFNETFSSLVAGSSTAITLQWNNTGPNVKSVRFDQDNRVGTNFPAFGNTADQCPSSSMQTQSSTFDPTNCPAAAKIGSVELTVPGAGGPVLGSIYTINKSPVPWFGVDVSSSTNPYGVTARFALTPSFPYVVPSCDPATDPSGYCQSFMRLTTTTLPNIQISSAKLVIGGADRASSTGTISSKPFYLAPTNCATALKSTAVFTPFAGSSVTKIDNDTMTGC
jgi:hypothetical protein